MSETERMFWKTWIAQEDHRRWVNADREDEIQAKIFFWVIVAVAVGMFGILLAWR